MLRIAAEIDTLLHEARKAARGRPLHTGYTVAYRAGYTKQLEAALATHSELHQFNEKMWSFGGGGTRTSVSSLAQWLVHRADVSGTATAISELEKYLVDETFPVQFLLALGGITVEQAAEIGDAVQVVPFSPAEFVGEESAARPEIGEYSAVNKVSAALLLEVQHPKLYYEPEANQPPPSRQLADQIFVRLERSRLCLCLVKPAATVQIGRSVRLPAGVPLSAPYNYQSYSLYCADPSRRLYSKDDLHVAKRIHEAFVQLTNEKQDAISVPLSRLERALAAGYPTVDGFIDLGIALEALLLRDDEREELTFRLAVRGARLIGKDLSKRKRIKSILTALYQARSTAVHRGVLPPAAKHVKGFHVDELFELGCRCAAAAAEAIILRGEIEWDDLILS